MPLPSELAQQILRLVSESLMSELFCMDKFTGTTLGLTWGSSFHTVTDNAYDQGLLVEWGVGVSYLPTTSSRVGELTFGLFQVFVWKLLTPYVGGADTSKFVGDLKCVWV